MKCFYFLGFESLSSDGSLPSVLLQVFIPIVTEPNVKWHMAHQFTTPWYVLDLIEEKRTRATEIQVDPWCVTTTERSSLKVLYRGDTDVPFQGIIASHSRIR